MATQSSEDLKDPFAGLGDAWKDKLEVKGSGLDIDQIKFVVYGESGVGKTVFSSSWPKPVYLDIDKGMASVRREVHRFSIDAWEDLVDAVSLLYNEKHPFKTVVVDSLNELQRLSMRNIITKFPGIRRSYNDLASLSDYGKMLDDYDKMIRWIRSLPMNVVFIAQVASRTYETDPVQPQLTGKQAARDLCRMADIVGYLEKGEPEGGGPKTRIMVFDAVNYITKDRSGSLPARVENPSYDVLSKYWE